MSKVAAYYHIVFCTKRREMTIPLKYKNDVYRFIGKIISESNSKLLRIDGIQNHIHILLDLHPTVALAKLLKTIKTLSSGWMARDGRFDHFDGWGEGYFASTISPHEKRPLIDYIINQENHHLKHKLDDEVKSLYRYADIEYDDRDLR